jgi:hypothetical protein
MFHHIAKSQTRSKMRPTSQRAKIIGCLLLFFEMLAVSVGIVASIIIDFKKAGVATEIIALAEAVPFCAMLTGKLRLWQ